MNDIPLLEDDLSASDDAFSGQPTPENNSKEEKVTPKKAVKAKASRVTAEPVKVAIPAAAKSAPVAKKAAPKKASEEKAEKVEPKPVDIKKVAAAKTPTAPKSEPLKKAAAKGVDASVPMPTVKAAAAKKAAAVQQPEPPKKAVAKIVDVPVAAPAKKAEAAKKTAAVQPPEAPKKAAAKVVETPAPTPMKKVAAVKKAIAVQQPAPAKKVAAKKTTQPGFAQPLEVQPKVVPDEPGLAESTPVAEQDTITGQPISDTGAQGQETANFAAQQPAVEQPNDASAAPSEQLELTEQGPVAEVPEIPAESLVAEPQAALEAKAPAEEVASEQPVIAEQIQAPAKTSRLRKITFQLKFSTVLGESLYVTGDHDLLGNNVPENAFPLSYLNENYWVATLEIPEEAGLSLNIAYNYILKNVDGTFSVEWGNDKVIGVEDFDSAELLLIDSWNSSSFIENTYYTEPFQEVLLTANFTEVTTAQPEKVTHIFRSKAPLLAKGQALCIIGSIEELGSWSTEKPILLSRKQGEVWNTASLDLSNANFPFLYKYGVFDTNTQQFIQYENGDNRILYDGSSPEKLTVVSDGFAQIPNNGFKGAGVAIPVFSLRSEKGFGVGEFPDLKLMVDWAKQVGLKLIQILPVNDTTATHSFTDSYPYAAISAFALHPLYLHIPAIVNKDNKEFLDALQDRQVELNSKSEVDYVSVMQAKWDLIKQIFPSQKATTFASPGFREFFEENSHWLIPYAAFSYFREQNKTSDFSQWSSNQSYNKQEIDGLAGSPENAADEISVYYYIQYHLHLQLTDAAKYAHQNGIIVKGDIPIGIYRNSCDAWQCPELYNMDMQAGAPPDDFAVKGQNWGFPTYNWQRMREDGFSWWKKRFKQMSYYFDAFRIDHILGFFRIWSIPMHAVEGIMGHFVPALPVHVNEIAGRSISFSYDRFCKPFINSAVLWNVFGSDQEMVKTEFLQPSVDGTYSLKPEFDTQRKVEAYFANQEANTQNNKIKEGLYELISNVILFEVPGSDGEQFHFRISMADTDSFKQLDGHSQYQLKELYINYFFRRQDDFWRKEAMLKLPELKRSTNMLICGEDLGMVPSSVPGVMKELAILSLEIQRMPKDITREFFHPNDAPYLSVVTPSTHDMSTVRGWWEEDRAATQRFYNSELGQWGTAPYFCEPWINRIIVLQHLYSPAMLSIFQLQDLLGISASLRRENPAEERINVPANPKHYWRYRMHLTLENLINEGDFTSELAGYVSQSGR